jgi:hypothetical protein
VPLVAGVCTQLVPSHVATSHMLFGVQVEELHVGASTPLSMPLSVMTTSEGASTGTSIVTSLAESVPPPLPTSLTSPPASLAPPHGGASVNVRLAEP